MKGFSYSILFTVWSSLLLCWGAPNVKATSLIPDRPGRASAGIWKAGAGSPDARKDSQAAVRLPLRFGDDKRAYWDVNRRMDLDEAGTLELELSLQSTARQSISLHLKSGRGWYTWNGTAAPGRCVFSLSKASFTTEGKPAGWNRIDTLRLSAWKGDARDNGALLVYGLRTSTPSLLILKATESTDDASEQALSARTAERLGNWLGGLGVRSLILAENDLSPTRLKACRTVILPFNPKLPAKQRKLLERHIHSGGKLMVFYSEDADLAEAMGLRLVRYVKADRAGQFTSFRFAPGYQLPVPETLYQNSWNLFTAMPRHKDSHVLASWYNDRGENTDQPAWLEGPGGLWMTHILLAEDPNQKALMLAGLLGRYDENIWRTAAREMVNNAQQLGPYHSLDQALMSFCTRSLIHANGAAARSLSDQVKKQAQTVEKRLQQGRAREAFTAAMNMQDALHKACALSQSAREPEFRGIWDHEARGWVEGNWNDSIRFMVDNGFNAIFPNALWAGCSLYPSKILPLSVDTSPSYDPIGDCVQAAKAQGVQVHLWKVCWKLGPVPDDFRRKLAREGRLQLDARGKPLDWLSPSHPDNIQLELDAIREAVKTYAPDGIHLDYIRYPNRDGDYSPSARKAFERDRGRPVKNWPKDVLAGGALQAPYLDWRADQITAQVRRIRQMLLEEFPGVRLSAAVFGKYPSCRAAVGQDWALWLREGLVDFVCPMNYNEDADHFEQLVLDQLALPGASHRVYPGIGVSAGVSQLNDVETIDQINRLRKQGANGFVLFSLSPQLKGRILPALSMGQTRPK